MDFDDDKMLCRLCLSGCEFLIHIFEASWKDGGTPWNVIVEHLRLDISKDDGLPETVCRRCMLTLEEFAEFKSRCMRSELILKRARLWRTVVGPQSKEGEDSGESGDRIGNAFFESDLDSELALGGGTSRVVIESNSVDLRQRFVRKVEGVVLDKANVKMEDIDIVEEPLGIVVPADALKYSFEKVPLKMEQFQTDTNESDTLESRPVDADDDVPPETDEYAFQTVEEGVKIRKRNPRLESVSHLTLAPVDGMPTCYICDRLFETGKGLSIHMSRKHFLPSTSSVNKPASNPGASPSSSKDLNVNGFLGFESDSESNSSFGNTENESQNGAKASPSIAEKTKSALDSEKPQTQDGVDNLSAAGRLRRFVEKHVSEPTNEKQSTKTNGNAEYISHLRRGSVPHQARVTSEPRQQPARKKSRLKKPSPIRKKPRKLPPMWSSQNAKSKLPTLIRRRHLQRASAERSPLASKYMGLRFLDR